MVASPGPDYRNATGDLHVDAQSATERMIRRYSAVRSNVTILRIIVAVPALRDEFPLPRGYAGRDREIGTSACLSHFRRGRFLSCA